MTKIQVFVYLAMISLLIACAQGGNNGHSTAQEGSGGLRVAYVNGDSIIQNYKEFRVATQAMNAKQRKAEEQLQVKSSELEKDIMAYQRKVQGGTLSRNEMEAQERRLAGKQEALLAERDLVSEELYQESAEINERLKKILREKLNDIKEKEGYDFILSYMEGGPILVADAKHDITKRVLDELNNAKSQTTTSDSLQ